MSELTGVPSLSPAHRQWQVLLKGRGKCGRTIKDLYTVEEGKRKKKRKWCLMSDTEDDSHDSSEEFVEIVPKLAKRNTPRRKAAILTPRMKRMKDVERERQSPDCEVSPVPPVRRVSVGDEDDHQQASKCTKLNFLDSETVYKVKNNDGVEISEENGVIKQVVSDDIIKEDMVHIEVSKNISNDKQSNEVKDLVNASAKLSDGICLPPGYGSDKLGKVLMRLLEEKIKVSTSHSERELLRKTIHVLVCGGCKDREKHNKVKCRRCEDRDQRKVEDKRKEEVKGKVDDKDKQKIVDKNGNIINKNVFVTTTKESPTKSIVNNDIKGPIKKDEVVPKSIKARKEDRSKVTAGLVKTKMSVGICCEKCGQKFKQLEDLKEHSKLVHEHGCNVTSCEMIFVTQNCLDLHTDEKHRNTKPELRHGGVGDKYFENKENDSVENDTENHAMVVTTTPMCEDKDKGSLKDGLIEDLGMIDRDRIFSDIDDPEEDLNFADDLVLDTVSDAAHVELIHDDEIDTELVIGGGGMQIQTELGERKDAAVS